MDSIAHQSTAKISKSNSYSLPIKITNYFLKMLSPVLAKLKIIQNMKNKRLGKNLSINNYIKSNIDSQIKPNIKKYLLKI